jgi:hypothetical protein
MASGWMVQVFAQVVGCDAEVYLNDVPVARLLQYQSAAASLPVHPWIVAGPNTLKLVVNPGPVPASALQSGAGGTISPNAKARARIIVVPMGELPSVANQPLLEVLFVAQASSVEIGPKVVSSAGSLPVAYGRRIWERASRLAALTPDISASALQFVSQVRDVLQQGQARRLAPLMRPKIADTAASYGLDGEQKLVELVQQWEAFAKSPNWELAPILPEQASLRLCGGGRFVDCIGKDWLPLIRSEDITAGGVMLGMGIAVVEGKWSIVA